MIEINYHSKKIGEMSNLVESGFIMTFDNGNTISVQFGMGNYCANRKESKSSCVNAEIAIWNEAGDWHDFGSNIVKGWCSPDEVAKWIFFAANFEVNSKEHQKETTK